MKKPFIQKNKKSAKEVKKSKGITNVRNRGAAQAKAKSILEKIGFTEEQSAIYRCLLQYGPLSMSDIVRKTNMHRPAVYKVVPELIYRELVSQMPKGKYKMYLAESPDRLETLFNELEDDFNSEIHALHETYDARDKKPSITFSEGDKAIKNVFSDIVHNLKQGDTYYRYSPRFDGYRKKFVPQDYSSVRDKKQLERLIITDEPSLAKMSKRLGKAAKAVPADFKLFDTDVNQIIYGNKVAFIDYNSHTVVTIENEMIAEFQKKLFKILYKKL